MEIYLLSVIDGRSSMGYLCEIMHHCHLLRLCIMGDWHLLSTVVVYTDDDFYDMNANISETSLNIMKTPNNMCGWGKHVVTQPHISLGYSRVTYEFMHKLISDSSTRLLCVFMAACPWHLIAQVITICTSR